jgi:uncharacterized membrane protein HdeD (DUF308 family)
VVSSWIAPLLRAVPAIALAIVVTFSADHSATLGLVTFGAFALLSGAVMVVFALRQDAGITRTLSLVQGALGVISGVAALAVTGGGVPYLVFVVSTWAVATGFIELYLGLRARRSTSADAKAMSRDLIFAGGLTVVLAIVVLLVPPGFSQPFTGPDGIDRELTASVIIVGVLGAYWAVVGVFLVIAALSLKWADAPAPAETKA